LIDSIYTTPIPPPVFAFAWPIAGAEDRALVHAAALSAFSVHHFHPEAEKIFLVPESEMEHAGTAIPPWARELVSIQPVSPPDVFHDRLFRSRWIKTHALRLLSRDVILLDTDTLMVAPVSSPELDEVDAIGVARDRVAADFKEIDYRKGAQELFARAGWKWPTMCNDRYFNTGVIAYRHGAAGLDFAETWESTWWEFVESTALHYDQAAFNYAFSQGECVSELPVSYNCPVVILPSLAADSRIYHYYSSGTRLENLRCHLMGAMLARSLQDSRFSPDRLRKRLIRRRHPYVSTGLPARAYRNSRQPILFLRARISELPGDAAHGISKAARALRSGFRHSVKSLPPSLRRFGRSVRDRLTRKA